MKRIIASLLVVIMVLCVLTSCTKNGKSAYEIAVENGFKGDELVWLESLKGADGQNGADGKDGKDGNSINLTLDQLYESAKQNGFSGTYLEFLKEYLDLDIETSDAVGNKAISLALLSSVSVYADFVGEFQNLVGWGRYETVEEEYSMGGSGIIYKLDKSSGTAYIITNHHVVYDIDSKTEDKISDKISIYLYGNETEKGKISAEYIGGSMTYDIAVLKVENSDIIKNSDVVAVDVKNSDNIFAGDSAIAIGNPSLEGISLTSGVVSVPSEYISMLAVDEKTTVTYRVMRIDTPVNSGNSGGGIFSDDGKLIGILNAKAAEYSIENMAYAIPSNIAVAVAENIIDNCDNSAEKKTVFKAYMGVKIEVLDSTAIYDEDTQRVYIKETISVNSTEENSIASKHFQAGDIINSVEFGGKKYEFMRTFSFIDIMLYVKAGDTVVFNVTGTDGNQRVIAIQFADADIISVN